MGRLSDQLRRELAADARRANQRAVSELVSNADDSNQPTRRGVAGAVAQANAERSEQRKGQAREFLREHPEILAKIGIDATHRLQSAVPGLETPEAHAVLDEFKS